MSKIKLLVEVDEKEYKTLSKMSEKEKVNELSYYERIIANGKPYDDSGDLISRSALKEYVKKVEDYESAYTICAYIDNAPTVEPERPQGLWTFDEKGYFYCDQCGKYPRDQYATTDFCPKCGADMRGEKE